MAIYFADELESLDLSLDKRFAFGQDYMGRWSSLATRPAWELIRHTNLEEIPEHASSQSRAARIAYELRRARAFVQRRWRKSRRTLRRLSAVYKS
jgi:hypothetical protein